MSSQKQRVTIRDLAEEAKKRIVFLAICVVGLSYIMSCEFFLLILLIFFRSAFWNLALMNWLILLCVRHLIIT